MPEIRYYTVTQEREVRVTANSPGEAAAFADAVFHQKPTDLPATQRGPIRELDLVARED